MQLERPRDPDRGHKIVDAQPPAPESGHVGAWLLWLVAAALPALTTRNPAYLLLLLLALGVVRSSLPELSPQAAGWGFFLKLTLFLSLFTVPLNALTAHYGETVLFTLPRSIPLIGWLIGGPITLEATAYGFLSGLGLLAVILVFATFNRAVDPYRLLRSVPPVLFQTSVMASIALSFVPQAATALHEIRQAQAIRGHRWRGLRDLLPLFLPLLTTGLERATQMAESMEARGFGMAPRRGERARAWGQRLLLPALTCLLAGLLWRGFQGNSPTSTGLLLGGAAGLGVALVLYGRSSAQTRYRQQHWRPADTAVALAAVLLVAGYVAVRRLQPEVLSFLPYPRLHWPAFNPALGAGLLALTAPAIFYRNRSPQRPRGRGISSNKKKNSTPSASLR